MVSAALSMGPGDAQLTISPSCGLVARNGTPAGELWNPGAFDSVSRVATSKGSGAQRCGRGSLGQRNYLSTAPAIGGVDMVGSHELHGDPPHRGGRVKIRPAARVAGQRQGHDALVVACQR